MMSEGNLGRWKKVYLLEKPNLDLMIRLANTRLRFENEVSIVLKFIVAGVMLFIKN